MTVLRKCRIRRGQALALCCLLLACLDYAKASDVEQDALRHFSAAQRAQRAGQLDQAAQEYRIVIRLLPDTAEAYASLGLVYNAQGKFDQSAQALRTAEKLRPGLTGVSLYLGIDYLKQRKAGLALPYLEEAVRLEPKNEQAYMWLSHACAHAGKTQAAIDSLLKANALVPGDPVVLLDLAHLYRRAADGDIDAVVGAAPARDPIRHQVYGDIYKDEHAWQNARAHYYKALELNPNWRGAHFGLAEIAFRNQELDLSAREYRLELGINPRSAAALARLGEIALLQGRPNDALPLFDQALRIAPDEAARALGMPHSYPADQVDWSKDALDQLRHCLPVLAGAQPGAVRSLAVALVDLRLGLQGDFDRAWTDFRSSIPQNAPAGLYQRAMLNFDRMDMEAAASDLRSWLRIHPGDLQARYLLARTCQDLSFDTLQKLLATSPGSYPAHQALAEIYRENQQNEKALQEYAIVEKMAPNLPGLHLSVGSLLLAMHRDDAALQELQSELAVDPENPVANKDAGEIYLNRADAAKAIPCLEKAVQEDPALLTARQQLGKAYYNQKEFAKAAVALKAVLPYDSDGSAHFQLGLVYRALGDTRKADEQFELSRTLKIQNLSHSRTELATFQKQSQ